MEILTLVKANIKRRKGAFIAVILLTAIIAASSLSIFNFIDSMDRELERSFSDRGDPTEVCFVYNKYYTPELEDKVRSLDIVQKLEVYDALDNWYNDGISNRVGNSNDGNSYYYMKLHDGIRLINSDATGFEDSIPALEKGEVYLPLGCREKLSCKVGDTLETCFYYTKYEFKIKGFVQEPQNGSTQIGWKQVFISDEDFDELTRISAQTKADPAYKNDRAVQNGIEVKVFNTYKSPSYEGRDAQFQRDVNLATKLGDLSSGTLTRAQSVNYSSLAPNVLSKIVLTFIAVLFVVALVIMGHSISSEIEIDRKKLGILKSQGFTVWQIRLSYIVQYVLALVIGSVIGLIISVPLLKVMGKLFMTVTGIWTDCSIDFLSNIIIALIIIAVFVVFIFFATRKLARISPVNALNNAHKDVHFTGRLNVPMKQGSLSFTMSLRALTSGLRHYIFVFLITVLLMFFMVTIFNLTNGIDFGEMFGYNWSDISAKLFNEFEQDDMRNMRNKLTELDPKAEVDFVAYTDNILADDVLYGSTATDNLERYYKPIRGKLAEYDNEVVETKIVARELEKDVGDTITVSNSGNKQEYTIVGVIQSTSQAGRLFCMTLDGAKKIGIRPFLSNIYIDNKDNAENIANALNKDLGDKLFAKVSNKTTVYESTEDLVNMFLVIIIAIVVGVSAVFLLVAVSLLCKVTFLRERTDIGIFKATGFTTGNLRAQFSIRFLIIGILGCLVGTVIAIAATNPLLSLLMSIVGMTDFMHSLTVIEVLIPAAVICACFAGFSYMSSKRIKSVQTTELICE